MENIQVFEYRNNKVRTVDVDGEAWFVLKDVCGVLEIADHNDANKVLWMEKSINQCFERHNREARLKESGRIGRKVL